MNAAARFWTLVVWGGVITAHSACDKRHDDDKGDKSGTAVTAVPTAVDSAASAALAASAASTHEAVATPPQWLYLPDGGDVAWGGELTPRPGAAPLPTPSKSRRCPPEMVDVDGSFCIDRYEARLVDKQSGEELSPYYPPDAGRAKHLATHWKRQRAESGTALGRTMPLPELPDWQLGSSVEVMVTSKADVVPSGYLDANTAEHACQSAGKRLCSATEWVTACRGQQNRQFPYGSQYQPGACNVFREAHPAYLLHGNASEGHLDPRLNLVDADGGPLLRKTGSTPRCRSDWGSDAAYDMVGNLDEWVDDAEGAFHGGFFARSTKLGCDARISTHPRQYSDYSLGVRCCK